MLIYAPQVFKIRLVFHTLYLWNEVRNPRFCFSFLKRNSCKLGLIALELSKWRTKCRGRRKKFECMWVRATCLEQMLMKKKKVGHNCCANSINRSRNRKKKKSVRQIVSYFWFHNFLVCEKSVVQIFILLCMNVKSEPISYSWNFEVGSSG